MRRIRITVPPPDAADYDVVVEPGALDRLGEHAAEAAPGHRYAVLADAAVAALYGERVRAALERAGLRADVFPFDAGEARKTRETWAALTDALLDAGYGRDGVVIGLGGGVAGDLAGFVAATFMRGVPIVQVPTSLLAMVDASVGGKTGVDAPHGKNLIGAFHPPRRVVVDPDVLATLPDRELRCGLAEAVKHGAIADADYLAWIEDHADALLAREPAAMTALVRRSVEIKADFVAADPFEAGPRKALNFGHTVGHAIETAAGYDVPHGFAVAIGMVVEAEAGRDAGITDPDAAERLRSTLRRLGLPTTPPDGLAADRLLALMRLDKKARAARPRFTLLERVGVVARGASGEWSHALDDARIRGALAPAGG
ncbi:MAG TPA: 3-dehydroquinate synthase [Longimicrobiales bacterium]